MKSPRSPRIIKFLIPLCGILGLKLRLTLFSSGIDDKGLLVSGHPAWIGLLVLTAAVAAAVLLCIRVLRGSGSYYVSFPCSNLAAASNILAAVSAAICAFTYWRSEPLLGYGFNPVALAARLLGGVVLSLVPAAFLLAALCRRTGRKPSFLLHVLICVYFAIQALTLYQSWSFDPQIQDYCFQLFACIALSMTAYRLAMFDTGKGSHRRLWLWGLAAVYLCCLSMDGGLFYISGALWAFCSLSHLRRHRYLRYAAAPIREET